jgi:hypothetical protein
MAAIDRDQLLSDAKLWLPESNVLSDAEMLQIIEFVIQNQIPADDDQYYAEALCKSLRAIALANNARYQVDSAGKRKEQVGDVEVQWFERTSVNVWPNYIDSLKDICPLFGYTGLNTGIGMKINPGDKFVINDCPCPKKLIF